MFKLVIAELLFFYIIIVSADDSAEVFVLSLLLSLCLLCDAPDFTTGKVGFKSAINFVIIIFFYGSMALNLDNIVHVHQKLKKR